MKRILTLSFLLVALISNAQEYTFKPNWKKGDVKQITRTEVESKYEDDVLISEDTSSTEARLKVLKVGQETYTIELLFENQALKQVVDLYEEVGEDLKKYKDLKLVYSINKETGAADLQNWKDAQKFMHKSFAQVSDVVEKKVPGAGTMVDLIFTPIKRYFASKEGIEAYMKNNIDYLLLPYVKDYTLGETDTIVDSTENPFNKTEQLTSKTMMTLQSVDEASKVCTFQLEVDMDMSGFVAMFKEMMVKMAQSFGVSDSSTEKKVKEFDDFQMDVSHHQITTFDLESTWVTRVVQTIEVIATDPKKGVLTRKSNIITTTVW